MWTWADLEALNPLEPGQKSSFLNHIFEIGAATPELLCRVANTLDNLVGAYVMGFAQLPFPVNTDPEPFHVRGWREGVVVELVLQPAVFVISPVGRLRLLSDSELCTRDGQEPKFVRATQVTALVRLWGTRARLHETYVKCLSHEGLKNRVIGKTKRWMQLPEVVGDDAPLTAQAFQAEVTRRIQSEIIHAVQTLVGAYSIAALEELPTASTLFGYFAMVAPGRIACASTPIPLISGLCNAGDVLQVPPVKRSQIELLLSGPLRREDRVLGQLMAMARLLKQGEPELALVGCVSAIEWFLNERFPYLIRRSASGHESRASISTCLRSQALLPLPELMKSRLLELSRARNAIVHGSPPMRRAHNNRLLGSDSQSRFEVDPEFVREGLFLGLELYRFVNRLAGSQGNAAQLTLAPERSFQSRPVKRGR